MKFDFGADAAADTGYQSDADAVNEDGPDGKAWLDLFGKLSIGINNVATELATVRNKEQARLRHVPVNIPLFQKSVPGAAVTDIKDFGGPQPGREWIVRLLIAVADPPAANASIVTWYVGQNVPGSTAGVLPVTMVRWQFPSVPGFEKFTSDVIRIMPNEHLIAGLTSIPASSNIGLSVVVLDQLQNDPNRAERS